MEIEISWKLCRVCLQKNENLIELKTKDKQGVSIEEKISQISDTQSSRKSFLKRPEKICTKCLQYLNISYKFQQICAKSDELLNNFLETELLTIIKSCQSKSIAEKSFSEKLLYNVNFPPFFITDTSLDDLANPENDDFLLVETNPVTQEFQRKTQNKRQTTNFKESRSDDDPELLSDPLEFVNSGTAKIECLSETEGEHTSPVNTVNKSAATFACPKCNKKFQKWNDFTQHRKVHEGCDSSSSCDDDHKTNYTPKRKIEKTDINPFKGNVSVGGRKPALCSYCDKIYTDTSTLKRHIMRFHTNERPHCCKICGKGYVRPYLLRNHLKTHGERFLDIL